MAARKKKTTELSPQPDASAPLDGAALLKLAEALIKELSKDLLARAKDSASVAAALKARHEKEKAAERTADNYDTWRRNFTEQVAAAWFLSCVFVRTLEDRGLLDRARLAGPGAMDSQRAFFALMPSLSERDYLLTVFRELCHLPAAEALFDARHNPVWLLGPSAEAARKLLEFFRTPNAEAPAFRFGGTDTRFLGDLYQDLSENVRKRYALLQTPRFVERFILDRTLTPAIDRFGLEDTTLIDPTCGSGHFLLGAYDRLFDEWLKLEPAKGETSAATKALAAVHGSDINPYAVAIAKFRLTLAFLEKGGFTRLKDAPKLPLQVVVADSLLHNPHAKQLALGNLEGQTVALWKGSEFVLEDEAGAREVLHKTYAAVVGNPPYITVKDAALRDRYRSMYSSAFREYSLAVPFKERFFQLARDRGYVGMITANSFMKREFGKKVIEEYLPTVNLTTVVNTSGAYIPGHGTPTVLLIGTSEAPQRSTVHTVLASRGEPSTPADPEQGEVWRSITMHGDEVGFENDYISVTVTERSNLAKHPWSLGGGGATELKALLEQRADSTLADVVDCVGFSVITGEDNVLMAPREALNRARVPADNQRRNVVGEEIRDWSIADGAYCVWPNDSAGERLPEDQLGPVLRYLWPYRTVLKARKAFGVPVEQKGIPWWALREVYSARMQTPLTITFAFVATHNHFVLDRGGKVFKQSAPIIKLPPDATEDDHYALLAYLNSSTACFWMKQVFFPKYGAVKADHPDPARNFYEFAGTGLQQLPIPHGVMGDERLRSLGEQASDVARRRAEVLVGSPTGGGIDWAGADRLRQELIFMQEEIDWRVYELFGLIQPIEPGVSCGHRLMRGQRAFESDVDRRSLVRRDGELLLARDAEAEQGERWDLDEMQALIRDERRKILKQNKSVCFIETNVFKRLWRDSEQNETEFVYRQRRDAQLREEAFLTQMEGKSSANSLVATMPREVGISAVPFLAALRYTDPGLEKYAAWQHTWDLQRREDAGEKVGDIPVPPKYAQTDFRKSDYWRLRGKLDVPKERFISYPGCESDEDGEPVYGWAGWDHLQRAKALAELYRTRKDDEGWSKERLMPMLAGLLELMPWLNQWHNEPSDELGGAKPAEQFSLYLDAECAEHGFTHDDLRHWRPPEKASKRRAPVKETHA